ncbi:hypothetical protein L209DRAFT_557320 [Thermothelomyces heterothallicus CBS 203.75]
MNSSSLLIFFSFLFVFTPFHFWNLSSLSPPLKPGSDLLAMVVENRRSRLGMSGPFRLSRSALYKSKFAACLKQVHAGFSSHIRMSRCKSCHHILSLPSL